MPKNTLWLGGNQTRDFIHVYDLVERIIRAAVLGKAGKIYNISGGKEVKISKIAKLMGGKTISIQKRPGEPDRSLADIKKIKKDLKWKPKISIETGISKLLSNINHWKTAQFGHLSIKKQLKIWFRVLKKNN